MTFSVIIIINLETVITKVHMFPSLFVTNGYISFTYKTVLRDNILTCRKINMMVCIIDNTTNAFVYFDSVIRCHFFDNV
jgi:hypothetical protein